MTEDKIKTFDALRELYVNPNPSILPFVEKNINPYFFTLYTSFDYNNKHNTKLFNKYLNIDKSLFWKLVFLHIKRCEVFYWNKDYIKMKKIEEDEFKNKVKKIFNWSEKEWNCNKAVVMKYVKEYADLIGLSNEGRKCLEIEEIKFEKINPLQKTLEGFI